MAELGIEGVGVGHWTDAAARTGCSVILFDRANTASGEVRGGAPATREFALLDPRRSVSGIDAVVMSGGSAFGLAAATGVVDHLEESGVGFETAHGVVPIVIGMSLYDLGVGDAAVRPDAEAGRAAASIAAASFDVGAVGAGAGATVGNWRGAEAARPAGIAVSTVEADGLVVSAIVVVNAAGDLVSDSAGAATSELIATGEFEWPETFTPVGENTTIGVIVTNGNFTKVQCRSLAEAGHDGLARAVIPAHTPFDGDAFVAVSCPGEDDKAGADISVGRLLAEVAAQKAIESTHSQRSEN